MKLEKIRLQQLQADSDVKVAAARVKAYNYCDSFIHVGEETHIQILGHKNTVKTPINI